MVGEAWRVGQWVAILSDPGCPCSCLSKGGRKGSEKLCDLSGVTDPTLIFSLFGAKASSLQSYAEGIRSLTWYSSRPFSSEFEGNGEDAQWKLAPTPELSCQTRDLAPDHSWPASSILRTVSRLTYPAPHLRFFVKPGAYIRRKEPLWTMTRN